MSYAFSKDKFFEPISGLSLAVFRIMLGCLLIFDSFKYAIFHKGDRYYNREYLFKYEYFEWVQLYPEPWMFQIHIWLMLVTAIFITLGLFYRISVVVFLFLFTYIFLLDQVEYLNHYYLVIVYLVVMCVLPMHARLSLDCQRKQQTPKDIPRWALWALLAQTEIVLLYAGIVKINPDWLAGEPLGMWLRERWQWHIFGDLIFEDWFILAGAWGTVILHLIGAPLLFFDRTRIFAVMIYVSFHLMNSYTFDIGIFPYMTIGATLLFFRPDWPAIFFRKLINKFSVPLAIKDFKVATPSYVRPKPVLYFLVIWLFFQAVIPLRPYIYPSNVAWTEEGHKFSWRMKLRNKESNVLMITVKDPETGKTWKINPFYDMDFRAAFQMAERINMLVQYAKFQEKKWKEKGYDDVIVTAQTGVSLNGRKYVPIVSPDLDLTEVEWNIWPADWILENNEPLLHWSERKW